MLFSYSQGGRPDASRVMLIITDGQSDDSVDESSMFAQSRNITVLAIRIGYVIGNKEPEMLDNIVDDVKANLILLKDFDDLANIVEKVQKRIVEAPGEACL